MFAAVFAVDAGVRNERRRVDSGLAGRLEHPDAKQFHFGKRPVLRPAIRCQRFACRQHGKSEKAFCLHQKMPDMKRFIQVDITNRDFPMKERHEIHSLSPIVDNDTYILILGTIPGELSILKNEYYAKSSNKLWDRIGRKYNKPNLESMDYANKISLLKQNHIGLWDMLSFCTREGSSDKTIKDEKFNDIYNLIEQYQNINKIIINGKKAYNKYKSKLKIQNRIKIIPLVSTSGSYWDCQPLYERERWIDELY